MSSSNPAAESALLNRRIVESTIRIGVLGLLGVACFQIMAPFLIPIIWGVIIAVAIYPLHRRFEHLLGERHALAAVVTTVVLFLILLVPVVILGGTVVDGAEHVAQRAQAGTLAIPPPPENVNAWPLIGASVSRVWRLASENFGAAVAQFAPQIKAAAGTLVSTAAGVGVAVFQFVIAIVIAGALLARANGGKRFARALAKRLAGDPGVDYIDLASATVRSVTRGVLGVAFIQATLAGIGFLVVGIPGAGLWAMICLIVAVVQLPIALITIPMIIYVFSTASTTAAVLFLIWNIPIAVADNILKPLMLGRGVKVPMLIIFVGAIGGMIGFGIIGLFLGAVMLTLAHKLFYVWLEDDANPRAAATG